jgi:putative ABC transport system substrate-binding protein
MRKFRNLCLLVLLSLSLFIAAGCKKKVDFTIGIIQIVSHDALNAARDGFVEELEKAGLKDGENIEILYRNPEGIPDTLNAMSIDLVRKCDLILAIATDTAVAVKAAAEAEGVNIPILFTAVTDPVDAKLVASKEQPGGNVTGTSDMNPVNEQVALIKEMLPSIKKMGIIYTVSETNSKVQSDMAKAKAEEAGIEVVVSTVTGVTDISPVANQLINSGIEALYVPTDNNLANNIVVLTDVTNDAKLPVICGEENQVLNGGTITLSISYKKLGAQTGVMAKSILLDKVAPASIPVGTQSLEECVLVVNQETLTTIGFTLPESIQNRLGSND